MPPKTSERAKPKVRKKARPVTFEAARRLALALPGSVEGPCYGTPGFRVGGRLFARLREDGDSLVVRTPFDEREALLAANPAAFFITDHYRGHPWMLIRLSRVDRRELETRLGEAWRLVAPKRLAASRPPKRSAS